MALDYSLFSQVEYDPYSYDDLAKVVNPYIEAYKEKEQAVSDFDTSLAEVDSMINAEKDPVAKQQLDNYRNSLIKQRDLLSTYGINSSTRQSVNNLKRDFAKLVTPVVNAMNSKKADIKAQQEAYAKDNTLRFSRNAYQSSLDDYLGDQFLDYDAISGNQVAAHTKEMASNLAKQILEQPEIKGILQSKQVPGQPYNYYEMITKQGATLDDINAMLSQDSSEGAIQVRGAMQEALARIKANISKEFNTNRAWDQSWADSYMNEGLMSALGSTDYKTFQNPDADRAWQLYMYNKKKADDAKALQQQQAAAAALDPYTNSRYRMDESYVESDYNDLLKDIQNGTLPEQSDESILKRTLYLKNRIEGLQKQLSGTVSDRDVLSITSAISEYKKQLDPKALKNHKYKQLLDKLGYDSEVPIKDLDLSDINERINALKQAYKVTDLNVDNLDNEWDNLVLNMQGNRSNQIQKLDYDGRIQSEAIKDGDIDPTSKLSRIEYSSQYPDKLEVTLKNSKGEPSVYLVDPSLLGIGFEAAVNGTIPSGWGLDNTPYLGKTAKELKDLYGQIPKGKKYDKERSGVRQLIDILHSRNVNALREHIGKKNKTKSKAIGE